MTLGCAEGWVLLPPDAGELSCCCDEFVGVFEADVEREWERDDELFTDKNELTIADLERWCLLFGIFSEPL